MGNGGIIRSGELQYLSAGSGVEHSEFNPSNERPVHFLQIWIQPGEKVLPPRYAGRPIPGTEENARKLLLSDLSS